jgi:ubiquinone/menaquinone biosynthesis C-methylase UbiE
VEDVAAHYDKIARIYPFLERIFCTPARVRRRAIDQLQLTNGDRVLEIGCGRGKNSPLLRAAVGTGGHVVGIDVSAHMLMTAQKRFGPCPNVTLSRADALAFRSPRRFDAAFFCLAYHTMPHRLHVLQHVWTMLRPGGRLVILDGKLPAGRFGEAILPLTDWLVRRTVLGNPYVRGWEHLSILPGRRTYEEFLFGSYYIATIEKERTATGPVSSPRP